MESLKTTLQEIMTRNLSLIPTVKNIDKAVEEKLKDYRIVDTSTQESILNGGYKVEDITAVHDGKTYTLSPHWDYDRDSSKVALSVDIEEGYHVND